jgi:putative ABC transport system permease protein
LGFLAGFILLTIIFTFVYQELSFDRFNKNGADIYRIHPDGYGVTPLCFGDKLKNRIPGINNIVRFSSKDLTIVYDDREVKIGKTFYTDPEIFQVFSFRLLSGNASDALKAPFSIVINKSTANKLFGNR